MDTYTKIGFGVADTVKLRYSKILTDEAMSFLAELQRNFNPKREALLASRSKQESPSFLIETAQIRSNKWTIADAPHDLQDRRVEITGPVDRKMVINALNSGANTFMADFEDSNSPTWQNCMNGQQNLFDAVRKDITYYDELKEKRYKLNDKIAVLQVRPRGLHLEEQNFLVDDKPISASLFDFGLYFFNNAHELLNRETGPYFYLPKLEHHLEARWWNEVFVFAQKKLGIKNGTIKATVLIETIWASFQMEEILYELRDHSAGLNCGRWDYIFSFIKTFKSNANYLFPNKEQITMESPCMKAYTQLLVQICHKRNAHAMGGMAAQIPIKNDQEANKIALEKVKGDKLREVKGGHDGTWVAHPALVEIAKEVFDEFMPEKNQIKNLKTDPKITASDLLQLPEGTITVEGVRSNINISILYLNSWLCGKGAAAIYHKMEDAATAEIARTQVWHWINHQVELDNYNQLTYQYCLELVEDEYKKIISNYSEIQLAFTRLEDAAQLFRTLISQDEFVEFLTIPAYELLKEAI